MRGCAARAGRAPRASGAHHRARGLRTRKASSWGALPAPGVGAPVRAASGKPARLCAVAVATQCIAVHVPCMCHGPCVRHACAVSSRRGCGRWRWRTSRRGRAPPEETQRMRVCVRACAHAGCASTHAYDHMSRRLQRRGRAHDLGSDRRRSESCRLPRRAGVPGVRGAGVRGCEGVGAGGDACASAGACMRTCVRASASEGWGEGGGVRARVRAGVQAG